MKKDQLFLSTIAPDAAEEARRHGLGLEIAEYCTAWNMDEQFETTHAAVTEELTGVGRRLLHAPFSELFPCAVDPKARELAALRYRQAIALARRYDARKIIIHGGFNERLYYPCWYTEQSIVFWKDFLKEDPGVDIVLENVLEEQPEITDDDAVKEITDDGTERELPLSDGSIRFDHVYFKYHPDSAEWNLTDIDFSIASGMTVGILGGTGSAKSTLVSLIPRLYEATEGAVYVGGHNVKDYTMETLREGCAMVLQKNTLFSGTIRDNLRWGDENATDQEMEAACRMACADEFISRMPDGYDTRIEQGGTNVSGGQKQRLCIARAILRKPKVLILDDSTSAVDTATDAKIRAALKEALPGSTKLIIAQRISSVMDADVILVLDDGKISGMGTHEQLMASNQIYREVYQSQQEGVSIDG